MDVLVYQFCMLFGTLVSYSDLSWMFLYFMHTFVFHAWCMYSLLKRPANHLSINIPFFERFVIHAIHTLAIWTWFSNLHKLIAYCVSPLCQLWNQGRTNHGKNLGIVNKRCYYGCYFRLFLIYFFKSLSKPNLRSKLESEVCLSRQSDDLPIIKSSF